MTPSVVSPVSRAARTVVAPPPAEWARAARLVPKFPPPPTVPGLAHERGLLVGEAECCRAAATAGVPAPEAAGSWRAALTTLYGAVLADAHRHRAWLPRPADEIARTAKTAYGAPDDRYRASARVCAADCPKVPHGLI
ncbi:hypothetical protein ABZ612_32275 [Streptomyces avermitilis]|uniref:hypothetical protein n=1 Tax=Streptomyces avermitilis TaxID=33903 RepID=UPI003407F776